jgi:hypothetical protein
MPVSARLHEQWPSGGLLHRPLIRPRPCQPNIPSGPMMISWRWRSIEADCAKDAAAELPLSPGSVLKQSGRRWERLAHCWRPCPASWSRAVAPLASSPRDSRRPIFVDLSDIATGCGNVRLRNIGSLQGQSMVLAWRLGTAAQTAKKIGISLIPKRCPGWGQIYFGDY